MLSLPTSTTWCVVGWYSHFNDVGTLSVCWALVGVSVHRVLVCLCLCLVSFGCVCVVCCWGLSLSVSLLVKVVLVLGPVVSSCCWLLLPCCCLIHWSRGRWLIMYLLGRGVILYPSSLSLSLPPSVLCCPVCVRPLVCPPWLLCARVLAVWSFLSPLVWLVVCCGISLFLPSLGPVARSMKE